MSEKDQLIKDYKESGFISERTDTYFIKRDIKIKKKTVTKALALIA